MWVQLATYTAMFTLYTDSVYTWPPARPLPEPIQRMCKNIPRKSQFGRGNSTDQTNQLIESSLDLRLGFEPDSSVYTKTVGRRMGADYREGQVLHEI